MKENNNVSEVSETFEEFRKDKAFIKTLKALYGTNADGEGEGGELNVIDK